MRNRKGASRRAWALAALLLASLLAGCDASSVSVGVGVGVAAPWGGVAVMETAVPVVGPYHGGRYAPMW
jgi:hypothetical protein